MQVGITQNLVLAGIILAKKVDELTKEEKRSIQILFRDHKAQASGIDPNDPLAMLNAGSDSSGEEDSDKLVIFPPNTTYGKDHPEGDYKKGDARDANDIFKDVLRIKNQLAHVLGAYGKVPNFDLTKGINVQGKSSADILKAFQQQKFVDIVFNNMATQAAEFAKSMGALENAANPLRLLLVRRNEASHYGEMRRMYLEKNPFAELMSVPVNESKMYTMKVKGTTSFHAPVSVNGIDFVPKFTSYELEKGLDNPNPVSDDDANDGFSGLQRGGEEVISLNPAMFTAGADDSATGVDFGVGTEDTGISF